MINDGTLLRNWPSATAKSKPSDFPTKLKDVNIKYALDFDTSGDSIHALTSTSQKTVPVSETLALHKTIETLTK